MVLRAAQCFHPVDKIKRKDRALEWPTRYSNTESYESFLDFAWPAEVPRDVCAKKNNGLSAEVGSQSDD